MILFLLVTCSYTPILLKNAEKPTVIWLFTQNCFKSTVHPTLPSRHSSSHCYLCNWNTKPSLLLPPIPRKRRFLWKTRRFLLCAILTFWSGKMISRLCRTCTSRPCCTTCQSDSSIKTPSTRIVESCLSPSIRIKISPSTMWTPSKLTWAKIWAASTRISSPSPRKRTRICLGECECVETATAAWC